MPPKRPKTEIENVLQPGKTYRVDAEKYAAAKAAYLKALPAGPPGLTAAEIMVGMVAQLPEALFPGGEKAGWWAKAVQLDLEAKSVVQRTKTTPLRLHRA